MGCGKISGPRGGQRLLDDPVGTEFTIFDALAQGLDHFEDIFDLVAAGLVPKPASQTYDKFLGLHRVDAERAVMFEDLARNLEVPKALGMRTVLIVPRNLEESFGDVWEHEGRDGEHIDFVTDDLTTFLRSIR